MTRGFKLTSRLFLRDWRATTIQGLMLTIILTTCLLSGLNITFDRMLSSSEQQTRHIMGADSLVTSDSVIPDNWIEKAHQLGLETTTVIDFPSVISADQQFLLASIKAVKTPFPLRGETILQINGKINVTNTIPPPGEVWVATRILHELEVMPGSVIQLGSASLKITAILEYAADESMDWLNLAPKVLINQQDLAKLEIIQQGSRIEYKLLLKGTENKLAQFKQWLEPTLQVGQTLQTATERLAGFERVIARIQKYFNLTSLLVICLAGATIALFVRQYILRHQTFAAVLRSFGATRLELFLMLGGVITLTAFIAAIIGVGCGMFLQYWLVTWFSDIIITSSSFRWLPLLNGIAIGVWLAWTFSLPIIWRLSIQPPIKVLRHQTSRAQSLATWLWYSGMLLPFALLCYWQVHDWLLVGFFCIAIALVMQGMLVVYFICLYLISLFASHLPVFYRFGLLQIMRRPVSSFAKSAGLMLALFAFWTLYLLRNDMLQNWQQQLPENTPNYFAINLIKEQLTAYQQFLQKNNIETSEIYPVVRGRLMTLNDNDILSAMDVESKRHNALHRGLNLTTTNAMPTHNKLVAGRWWKEDDEINRVSIEANLASQLGIKMCDKIGFQIDGGDVIVTVSNIRSVKWDSFLPNFYFIFPDHVLKEFAFTYMNSFYLPKNSQFLIAKLLKQFPNLTIVDIASYLKTFRHFVNQASKGVEFILAYTLLIGFLILLANVISVWHDKIYQVALLRSLGANQTEISISIIVEYGFLGVLIGVTSIIGANVVAWLATTQLLEIDFHFNMFFAFISSCISIGFLLIVAVILMIILKHKSPAKLLIGDNQH